MNNFLKINISFLVLSIFIYFNVNTVIIKNIINETPYAVTIFKFINKQATDLQFNESTKNTQFYSQNPLIIQPNSINQNLNINLPICHDPLLDNALINNFNYNRILEVKVSNYLLFFINREYLYNNNTTLKTTLTERIMLTDAIIVSNSNNKNDDDIFNQIQTHNKKIKLNENTKYLSRGIIVQTFPANKHMSAFQTYPNINFIKLVDIKNLGKNPKEKSLLDEVILLDDANKYYNSTKNQIEKRISIKITKEGKIEIFKFVENQNLLEKNN